MNENNIPISGVFYFLSLYLCYDGGLGNRSWRDNTEVKYESFHPHSGL